MARYIDVDIAVKEAINACNKLFREKGKILTSIDAIDIAVALDEIPAADVVEVVRCGQCQYAEELEKHCEINRGAYKHCSLWRGDETRNVWHKYGKYYRDYSIVEEDGFCSEGRRKEK